MDRLTPMADKLISSNQTAFIKGRNILEWVVILHEILHEFRKSRKQEILFKTDFEKTYDKIKLEFVQDVLCRKGFP
jgi:hypothetical protein